MNYMREKGFLSSSSQKKIREKQISENLHCCILQCTKVLVLSCYYDNYGKLIIGVLFERKGIEVHYRGILSISIVWIISKKRVHTAFSSVTC